MDYQYALANPISKLLGKDRADFVREDFLDLIETQNIERITFHYTALDGKLKELKIPVANRQQAARVLTDGERVDGSSLFKGLVDVAVSDLYVVPLYKSAFLNPFDKNSLDFMCRFLTADGELAPFALDTILMNANKAFEKSTGMELYALGELEFFLISPVPSPLYPAPKQKSYHASGPFMKTGEILNEMVRCITQICGVVKYAHSEVGYVDNVRSNLEEIRGKQAEQLEIEFLPAPIVDAADYLVLARWLIRNIAYRHNCVATFAPKIEEDVAGNGMHVHMELRKNGRNIMTDARGKLSVDAKKLIGGLCTYASSITAFGNTVSSAYLRLVPNQEAPTQVCWSDLNRSAMIRVPLGWSNTSDLAMKLNPKQEKGKEERDGKQTVELRSPDGSALIHLLLAGITLAAEYGLTSAESLERAEKMYVKGNIFKNKELLARLDALPQSCDDSAKEILLKRSLYERENVFPPAVIDYIAKMLHSENDSLMNQYLKDLPADDKLREVRKIMHKDLHKH
jgi:glutamine synthetase